MRGVPAAGAGGSSSPLAPALLALQELAFVLQVYAEITLAVILQFFGIGS